MRTTTKKKRTKFTAEQRAALSAWVRTNIAKMVADNFAFRDAVPLAKADGCDAATSRRLRMVCEELELEWNGKAMSPLSYTARSLNGSQWDRITSRIRESLDSLSVNVIDLVPFVSRIRRQRDWPSLTPHKAAESAKFCGWKCVANSDKPFAEPWMSPTAQLVIVAAP